MRVTLNPLEFNTLSATLDSRQYDALLMGFSRVSLDPPARFFHSQGTHPFQRQFAGELSPAQKRVDELFALILSDPDETKRKVWRRELNTIANEQAWVTWMPAEVTRTPIRSRFGNMRPAGLSSSASSVVWNAEEFFVKPQARETN